VVQSPSLARIGVAGHPYWPKWAWLEPPLQEFFNFFCFFILLKILFYSYFFILLF